MTLKENTATLKILTAEKGDTSEYKMEVSNKVGKDECTCSVTVLGYNVTMECRVSGSQPMAVSWYKDDKEIQSDDKYKLDFSESTASLMIFSLEQSDGGTYTCRATNDAGYKESSGTLCVKEPPLFLEKPEGVSVVKVGDSKVFECKVVGTPEVSVRWFRDGAEIHQSVKHKMSIVDSLACLQISCAGKNDSGKYFCEACNEAYSNVHFLVLQLHLFTLDPPVFVKKTENVSTVLGDVAVFQCAVEGSPTLSVQWQKDENWILEDPEIERTFENNVATRFYAANQHSTSLSWYYIEPPYIQEKPELVEVTLGDPVRLECRVAGAPEISVKWIKDGQDCTDNTCKMRVPTIKLSDSGKYTCKAVNAAGASETRASMTVTGQ
uniref:Ig-like domain-containing protein n=1 Tax=Myripristis murdjan TaxID=586833 RepID=A0A667WSQ4_9TELE